MSTKQQALGLIGWLVVSFATAAVGALASIDAKYFYSQLAQPTWAPPATVFAPVWTLLFTLMGIAAWLVWRKQARLGNRLALRLFAVQLMLNALWSWLFFAWQLGAWAFVDVILLWTAIAATLLAFWRVNPVAGALLIPYLLWVSFAALLNLSLWQLNPGLLSL